MEDTNPCRHPLLIDIRSDKWPQPAAFLRFCGECSSTNEWTLNEQFNINCSNIITTDDFLTIDETLYGTAVQIGFKQFNSSKPSKYGSLFRSLEMALAIVVLLRKSWNLSLEIWTTATWKVEIYRWTDAQWLLSNSVMTVGRPTIQANRKGIPPEIKQVERVWAVRFN